MAPSPPAWLVHLTFTPALAARMQILTIWEVLTLVLGDDTQRSIPLLANLSITQARITSLMARIVGFKEGHQITAAMGVRSQRSAC